MSGRASMLYGWPPERGGAPCVWVKSLRLTLPIRNAYPVYSSGQVVISLRMRAALLAGTFRAGPGAELGSGPNGTVLGYVYILDLRIKSVEDFEQGEVATLSATKDDRNSTHRHHQLDNTHARAARI